VYAGFFVCGEMEVIPNLFGDLTGQVAGMMLTRQVGCRIYFTVVRLKKI
jgi:hypothetical protein